MEVFDNNSRDHFFKTGDDVLVNLKENYIEKIETGEKIKLKSLGFIQEIIEAGDLFAYAQKKGLTNEK